MYKKNLKPGAKFSVHTFSTHTWIIEDQLGNIWASYMGAHCAVAGHHNTYASMFG